MSMRPQPWPEPSEEIAAAVRVMYPGGKVPLPVAIRDQLGEVFTDEEFGAGFAARGKPGWSPGRLALVTVLQMAENLTDRQAAEAVREKISWKYALGMTLSDPGFDASVLSEFRARLIAHGLEERVLDTLLTRLGELGLLKAGGKQRTDSTHVVSAVRDLKPAGAGRGIGTGRSGGSRGRRAGLAAHGDQPWRVGQALWHPGRFLAVAHLPGHTHAAGPDLWQRCPRPAARGVRPRGPGLAG